MLFSALPDRQGLYDPDNESDSCGVAMITDIQGRRSHAIVADGLIALEHLEHRGAGPQDGLPTEAMGSYAVKTAAGQRENSIIHSQQLMNFRQF